VAASFLGAAFLPADAGSLIALGAGRLAAYFDVDRLTELSFDFAIMFSPWHRRINILS
jgi:hypothetical protein